MVLFVLAILGGVLTIRIQFLDPGVQAYSLTFG